MSNRLRVPVQIRHASQEDAEAIARVHVEGWRAAYQGKVPQAFLDGLSIPRRTELWEHILRSGHSTVRVAVGAQGVVGFLDAGPRRFVEEPEQGEIYALYVLPVFWGAGIGARLLEPGIEDLKARGFTQVCLWVLENNHQAQHFYRRHGFQDHGTRKEITIGGDSFLEVLMQRDLSRAADGPPVGGDRR